MTDPRPMFSVLMPTYNQARWLPRALDSVLAQTDGDWEAVVVNDGSTDETPEVLARYADRDPRIRPVHQENGGTGAALNAALARARGDWVCWLSTDDEFFPEKLAAHRRWIGEYPGIKFFHHLFRLRYEKTGVEEDRDLWGGGAPPDGCDIAGLMRWNYVSGISICVERALWERVGPFDAQLRYAQDYDMWLRLMTAAPAKFIPERLVLNRNHDEQGSETFVEACYYDGGLAAIRYLSERSWRSCFPGLDLSDDARAMEAFNKGLEAAITPDSVVYWLDHHPMLLARLAEFAAERGGSFPARLGEVLDFALAHEVPTAVRQAAWSIKAAGLIDGVGSIEIEPMDPERHAARRLAAEPGLAPLRKYLAQLRGRGVECAEAPPRRASVALVAGGDLDAAHRAAACVMDAGHHAVLVRVGEAPGLRVIEGVCEVSVRDLSSLAGMTDPAIGGVTVIGAMPGADAPDGAVVLDPSEPNHAATLGLGGAPHSDRLPFRADLTLSQKEVGELSAEITSPTVTSWVRRRLGSFVGRLAR